MFDSGLFPRLLLLLAVAQAGMGCGSTCSNTMVHLWQDSSGRSLPNLQPAQLVTTCNAASPSRETLAYCKTVPTPDDGEMHYCKTQWGGGGYNGWSSGALFGPSQWINITSY
jgi:hypothetical protein